MAQIIIEIKDGYEVAIAKSMGFSYPDDKIPPAQEHLDAIQSKLYEVIEPHYKDAIYKDPEVLAKKAEYVALILAKESQIKSGTK